MKIPKNILRAIIIILSLIAFESLMYEAARFICGTPTCLTSSLDDKIPFLTIFIYPYISWYFMLALVPYIIYLCKPDNFFNYITTAVISIIIAFVIFIAFPTTINRPEVIGVDITSNITRLIFSMDTPPVCCLPSMHCVLCLLFILYTINIKELKPSIRVLIALWSTTIIISTLFIKQHVIYDILAAIVLVFVSHLICKKFNLSKIAKKLHNKLNIDSAKD